MKFEFPGATRFLRFGRRTIVTVLVMSVGVLQMSGVALAADATPMLNGSNWLSGRGVNACANSDTGTTSCGGQGAVGIPWQCVELAQRLFNLRGWYSGHFGASYAYQIFGLAGVDGFGTQPNGGITSITPGDLIVHDYNHASVAGGGNSGHVAVVDFVDSGGVHVVEQNYMDQAHVAVYGFNGGWLSRTLTNLYAQSMPILGVVHTPKDMLAGGVISNLAGRIDLDWLTPSAVVHPGQYILSSDGRYELIFQGDGNLVLYYAPTGHALWASNTSWRGTQLVNQWDGNLVIYGPNGAVWSSGTPGRGAAVLKLQSDGNVVMYLAGMVGNPAGAIWSTHTSGRM